MRISTAFPSRYLKASDLDGPTTVTINSCVMEQVAMSGDPQPVVYLKGFQKAFVLNVGNGKKIAALYGDETNNWKGKDIVLFEAMVDFKGDTVPAIRVRAPTAEIIEDSPELVVYRPRKDKISQDAEEDFPPKEWQEVKVEAGAQESSLMSEGEAMARQGLARFRDWRDHLRADEEVKIKPYMQRLLATADHADKKQTKSNG